MPAPGSRATGDARMNEPSFGKLEKVDPESVWEGLADKFTSWLSEEGNLAQLGEAIGRDIEREKGDDGKGAFEADIVCKDKTTQGWVLIDYQIKVDDHGPLGRMVVNAASVQDATFVLISTSFSDKSLSTLDWLNRNSGESYGFFGVEIELWRIGESSFAPRFNAVLKANKQGNGVAAASAETASAAPVAEPSETAPELQHLEYWTAFCEVLTTAEGPFEAPQPTSESQMNFPLEQPGFVLISFTDPANKRIGIYLQLSGPLASANLRLLHDQKKAIEAEIISPLEWRALPDKQEGYIMIRWENVDSGDRSAWSEQHEWLRDTLLGFNRVFTDRIKDLDASNGKEVVDK